MEDDKLYYINQFGVRVVKCCASCRYKQEDNKMRYCMKGEGIVSPKSYCLDWGISDGLANAGKGGGKIKKGCYLQYCLKTIDEDNALAIERHKRGLSHVRKVLAEIRKDYEKANGSIYIDNP